MQLHTLDLIVLVAYMAGVTLFGWYFGRKQKNIRDYFLSDREVPWWALAGSIVATETSTVTFISVPAFAFAANARGEGGNLTFMQLVVGYMIGRLIIVALFIPLYFRGELFTVYQVLDKRFGGQVIDGELTRAPESVGGVRAVVDRTGNDLEACVFGGVVSRERDGMGGQHSASADDCGNGNLECIGHRGCGRNIGYCDRAGSAWSETGAGRCALEGCISVSKRTHLDGSGAGVRHSDGLLGRCGSGHIVEDQRIWIEGDTWIGRAIAGQRCADCGGAVRDRQRSAALANSRGSKDYLHEAGGVGRESPCARCTAARVRTDAEISRDGWWADCNRCATRGKVGHGEERCCAGRVAF